MSTYNLVFCVIHLSVWYYNLMVGGATHGWRTACLVSSFEAEHGQVRKHLDESNIAVVKNSLQKHRTSMALSKKSQSFLLLRQA